VDAIGEIRVIAAESGILGLGEIDDLIGGFQQFRNPALVGAVIGLPDRISSGKAG
jgi:hypothetical protein